MRPSAADATQQEVYGMTTNAKEFTSGHGLQLASLQHSQVVVAIDDFLGHVEYRRKRL
jgi:hypothetical protein